VNRLLPDIDRYWRGRPLAKERTGVAHDPLESRGMCVAKHLEREGGKHQEGYRRITQTRASCNGKCPDRTRRFDGDHKENRGGGSDRRGRNLRQGRTTRTTSASTGGPLFFLGQKQGPKHVQTRRVAGDLWLQRGCCQPETHPQALTRWRAPIKREVGVNSNTIL